MCLLVGGDTEQQLTIVWKGMGYEVGIIMNISRLQGYLHKLIRLVSAHTPQNNVKYTGGSGDKQTTSITLSISSFDNELW